LDILVQVKCFALASAPPARTIAKLSPCDLLFANPAIGAAPGSLEIPGITRLSVQSRNQAELLPLPARALNPAGIKDDLLSPAATPPSLPTRKMFILLLAAEVTEFQTFLSPCCARSSLLESSFSRTTSTPVGPGYCFFCAEPSGFAAKIKDLFYRGCRNNLTFLAPQTFSRRFVCCGTCKEAGDVHCLFCTCV